MDSTAASTLIAWLDREVWLVTAQAGEHRGGLIATSISSASQVSELPRMLVGINHQHYTHELIQASGAFALHLLSETNLEWVWRFGLQSGRDLDKLAGLSVAQAVTGSPLLDGAIGWMDCRVEACLETGDRSYFLGEVVQARVTNFAPPLNQKRLMSLAPSCRVTELMRQRHHESELDSEAIRAFRNQGPLPRG
jgi:flavin reductase (DIM6/NTAB) family NADH-FMN oxidoreductase RutF